MKSAKAKVLHEVLFVPMICHVMDSLMELGANLVVVTGHQAEQVEEVLAPYNVTCVRQQEQLGTGHAVLTTTEILAGGIGTALILCGDTPLVQAETLRRMIAAHVKGHNSLTVMTTVLENPTNYGRIVSNEAGEVVRIVEEKDASVAERQIREVNAGMYCVELEVLYPVLRKIGSDNAQGEMYLTDMIEIVKAEGAKVGKFICHDEDEILGVNSRVELAAANSIMQERVNRAFMLSGVSLIGSTSIFIEKIVKIGRDASIMGSCYLTGKTVIGAECKIGPFCNLHDCQIPTGSTIPPFTHQQGGKGTESTK